MQRELDILPPPLPWEMGRAEEERLSRADLLMSWGHAAVFAGGLCGITGGLVLVMTGALSTFVSALLFAAPVAGAAASVVFYAAAWAAEWRGSIPKSR